MLRLSRFLDARVLRLALVAACVWNCVLPSAIYACRCTGGVHLGKVTDGCASCAAKNENAPASCCQAKTGSKRSCCQAGGHSCGLKTADGKGVSAAETCKSGCCLELPNAKNPAVASVTKSAPEISFVPLAMLPATIIPPTADHLIAVDSIPPPLSCSRQVLFCVWRN